MSLDPYSPCPGGTGNKVKFCCSDLTGELEKVQRMLEGEQYTACLNHVERLQEKYPDRACLWAYRTMLVRAFRSPEEAVTAAADFFRKHPHNPIALAEMAMSTAAEKGGQEGMNLLQQALTAAGDEVPGRVYEAIGVVAQVLAIEGRFQAARAAAALQTAFTRDDRRPLEMLLELNASPGVPLVLKDDRGLEDCPEDAPWKPPFDEALGLANRGRWAEAADRLEKLTETAADSPALWRNLALLRAWVADEDAAGEALARFAALDVPLEDAVEAETLRAIWSGDPLGDAVDVLDLTYTVDNVDELQAALTSAPETRQSGGDLSELVDEGEPPPRAALLVFDRRTPDSADGATLETIPRLLCQAVLFGRQTDRDARLEVLDVLSDDLDEVKGLIGRLAGGSLRGEPDEEAVDKMSVTFRMISRRWRLPEKMEPEQFRRLANEHIERTVLQSWPTLPLGLLDGKSPHEAAGDEAYRRRVMAAVAIVEFWLEQAEARFDVNRLRSELGLPALGPIDPAEQPLETLPLVRLARVEVDKLSDDVLLQGFQRALVYSARAAQERMAEALVGRPGVGDPHLRLEAHRVLVHSAETSDEALQRLQAGREDIGPGACAAWDLTELPLRFQRFEGAEASRLIRHLQSSHMNEPGVAQALGDLLGRMGLLRPPGAGPAAPPPDEAAAAAEVEKVDAGKLWTPESQRPAGEKPKIWTPGMD